MATWIVGGVLLLAVTAIIRKMVSDRRKGKGCCSGSCEHCHGACGIHAK